MIQTPGAVALPPALPGTSPALRPCLLALSAAPFAVDLRRPAAALGGAAERAGTRGGAGRARARGKGRVLTGRAFRGPHTAGVGGGVLAKSAVAQRASADEIRIGMSAAFRGSAAGLGAELYRGAQAYYSEINARGGVFGRPISVVALDDSYNPEPCIRNTIQLLDPETVFFLSNYMGTPP